MNSSSAAADSAQTPRAAEHSSGRDAGRRATVDDDDGGGYAGAGATFAGVMLLVIGVLHVIAGLTAIVQEDFYVVVDNALVDFGLTGWGWVHVVFAVLLVVVGAGVLAAKDWAYMAAVVLAAFSLVDNFLFIPYYPFWSLLIIALDVFVIWALAKKLSSSV